MGETAIKVLHVVGSLNRGGLELLLLNSIHHSSQADFEPLVFARKGGILTDQYRQALGNRFFTATSGRGMLENMWAIRQLVQRENLRIIHTHKWFDSIFVRLALLFLPVIIIQSHHGYHPGLSSLQRWFRKLSFSIVDKHVFVSNTMKNDFIAMAPRALRSAQVVYNGIEIDQYRFNNRSATSDPINILMVGNLESTPKDPKTVIRALADLKFSVVCRFAGKLTANGPLHKELVELTQRLELQDSVIFLGEVEGISAEYQRADLFVLSSKSETFSLASIEAVASGLPVIANDLPVLKEVLGEFEGVFFFETGKPQSLTNALKEYHRQAPLSIDSQTLKNGLERFHIDKHIQVMEVLYKSV